MTLAIGTIRPEEAKVFDDKAGYHPFKSEDGESYGSFDVFWHDGYVMEDGAKVTDGKPGWYWAAGFPGCLYDGEPTGPFSSSNRAYNDAVVIEEEDDALGSPDPYIEHYEGH